MSAIIESRDGYGWTGGTSVGFDEDGYYLCDDSATTEISTLTKTIKIAQNRINPTYVFYQVRLYDDPAAASGLTSVLATITGLLVKAGVATTPYTTNAITIPSGGSTVLTVEGYSTADEVTIVIAAGTNKKVAVRPMNEI